VNRSTRVRAFAPEGTRAAPDGEHRVLHELLSQRPFPGHQQNVREHDPAVLAVERGHRVLVALTDPAQQRSVAAGTVATDGEDRRAGVPVRGALICDLPGSFPMESK
jgi:hypothetical protein